MAKCSREKLKQKQKQRQQQKENRLRSRKVPSKSLMAVIAGGIWFSVQATSNVITIYQSLDQSTKSIIEGILSQVTLRFMTDIRSLPQDEQIVQAGKLIAAQREIGKWLGQNKLPPFQNSFDKASLAKGLENLLVDGVAMSEDELQKYCAVWLEFWELSSSASMQNPDQPPRRKFKL